MTFLNSNLLNEIKIVTPKGTYRHHRTFWIENLISAFKRIILLANEIIIIYIGGTGELKILQVLEESNWDLI